MTPPVYAPEIRLSLVGRQAPAELRGSLSSVSCTTGLGGSDRLELTLANERLRWLDDPLFRLNTEVALAIGYAPDEPTQLFVGEVTGTDATFPADGMPTLRVVAQDRRTRLAAASPARWFGIPIPSIGVMPLPDLVVAPILTLEHGLLPQLDPLGAFLSAALSVADAAASIDDPGMRQRVVRRQHSQTTLEFLEHIAAENGWELVMEHGPGANGSTLRLMSPAGELEPDVTLRHGQSLIDFTPKLSTVGQVGSVSVRVWRPEVKLELTVTVGYDWDRQALNIQISPGFGLPTGGAAEQVLLAQEPVTVATAPRLILSKLLPRLHRRLTATGSCVGNPAIAAGHVLRIEGVGETYGGLYRITSARHTLDAGGYRTSFELRKEIWFGAIAAPSQGAVRVNALPLPTRA
jgi:uncharacterized protein